jgi:hypothetical protein
MRIIANDVTPEMGSEGSNPSLSAQVFARVSMRAFLCAIPRPFRCRMPELSQRVPRYGELSASDHRIAASTCQRRNSEMPVMATVEEVLAETGLSTDST